MAGEADIDTRQLPAVGVAPRAVGQWRNDVLIASILGVLSFVLYIIPALLWRPLFETPEIRVAVVAREMMQSGDYVVPTLGGESRLNKPPLPYWTTAATAKIIGGDDPTGERALTRAVEIPSAVAAAFAVFLLAIYGIVVAGRTAGVMSAMILGFSFSIVHFAQLGYGDTLLMASCAGLFCSAAWMLCVPHAGIVSAFAFGISLGLGMLTKGHIPLVLITVPLLIEIVIRHSFDGRKIVLFVVGYLVAACVASPWYFVLESKIPGAWQTMIKGAQEGVSTPHHWHSDNYTFYFTHLASGILPWTILLLAAWPLYLLFRRKVDIADKSGLNQVFNEHFRFFFVAALVGFIAFYAWPKKQDYYLLPLMPAIALASGFLLSRFKMSGGIPEERLAWWQFITGVVIGVTIALIPACPAVAQPAPTDAHSGISGAMDVIAQVHHMIGWALIPIGLAIIAFHFYSARQIVEGNMIQAAVPIALIGFGGMLAWSILWTEKVSKETELEKEAPRLRKDLDALGDVTLYAAGNAPGKAHSISAPMYIFYLQRPAHTLKKDLSKTPDPAKPRVLVADRETVSGLGLTAYLPAGDEKFVVLSKIDEPGWKQLSDTIANQKHPDEE